MKIRLTMMSCVAVAALTTTPGYFLFGGKSKPPERQYTPQEQELRADYKLAKDANDRELSACIWDYTKLQEALDSGPDAKRANRRVQDDFQCRAALEGGTAHPDLAEKYIAKFEALAPQREALIGGTKTLAHERDLEQCMSHVHDFEAEHSGINVAAFLTRCVKGSTWYARDRERSGADTPKPRCRGGVGAGPMPRVSSPPSPPWRGPRGSSTRRSDGSSAPATSSPPPTPRRTTAWRTC
jgi:hypothetical protein